jgi:hypothetical protein
MLRRFAACALVKRYKMPPKYANNDAYFLKNLCCRNPRACACPHIDLAKLDYVIPDNCCRQPDSCSVSIINKNEADQD